MLKNQVLDLTDELLNSGGSLNDDGDQGSANDRWRVDDNWCRNFVLNGSPNSGLLRFRHRRGLNWRGSLNRGRRLNWSRRSLDWDQIGEHDLEHPLDPETGYLSPSSIQVDVTSGLENVLSNLSLCVQQ